MTYHKFVMQFLEGLFSFNCNLFTYTVTMGDVFKAGTEKPADIMKFRAINNTTVLGINKLHKGGFTVLFNRKDIVNQLQDTGVEFEFTVALADDATIAKQTFSILVPHVSLTFVPTEDSHLKEIEECNELPTGIITKARQIKPISRRAPEQRAAHAIFALKDPNIANICIRDGLRVCGLRIYLS